MDERIRQIGENEALFREVNERIGELDKHFHAESERLLIVCECGAASCTERIEIRPKHYAALRADATQFAVVKGHETSDVERIVARRDGYDVVCKHPGSPAVLAQSTDT
jgi:hypothetical protein